MPHMLPMPAGQVGHPVALLILMITANGLIHRNGYDSSTR